MSAATSTSPAPDPEQISASSAARRRDQAHYARLDQLTAAGRSSGRPLGPLLATTHRGQQVDWRDLSQGHSLVVVFVKQGCPCSLEFQQHFNRLAATYEDRVSLVGVIDGSIEVAERYVTANEVPYPVLADADRQLIHEFAVPAAAYVALIDQREIGGQATLQMLWPGCSIEMMHDLVGRLADKLGEPPRVIDFSGLPGALTTGCPFAQ
ncbi:MAG TPA: redoxin domain-containing protein [Pirellulales bacterium]|nr:redoxin domain-containing protein [Pirellulales bacterium]